MDNRSQEMAAWAEQQMHEEQKTKLERYRILDRYARKGQILFTGFVADGAVSHQ